MKKKCKCGKSRFVTLQCDFNTLSVSIGLVLNINMLLKMSPIPQCLFQVYSFKNLQLQLHDRRDTCEGYVFSFTPFSLYSQVYTTMAYGNPILGHQFPVKQKGASFCCFCGISHRLTFKIKQPTTNSSLICFQHLIFHFLCPCSRCHQSKPPTTNLHHL